MSPSIDLEAVVNDRRVQVAAALIAAVVVAISGALLAAAHAPITRARVSNAAPAQPLNIPIIRTLPGARDVEPAASAQLKPARVSRVARR